MNAAQLFADLNTNSLTEATEAAASYFDNVRGLTVRQSFYVYPNDSVVCLNSVDGGYSVVTLDGDDLATFRHLYRQYFRA